MSAFVDHGADGTGKPLTVMLRTGRAGANTAGDHIKVTADALAQLPSPASGRFGREILIRTDGAGRTHKFVQWLTEQQVAYSVGFGLCESTAAAVDDLTMPPEYQTTSSIHRLTTSKYLKLSPDQRIDDPLVVLVQKDDGAPEPFRRLLRAGSCGNYDRWRLDWLATE